MPINGISNQKADWQSLSMDDSPTTGANSTFAAVLGKLKTKVQASQEEAKSQLGTPSSGVSGATLSPQIQALGSAALNKYQSGGNFSFNVNDSGSGSSCAGSTAAGDQLSGSFKTESLIAVGTMTPSGQLDPFSSAQIQSEQAMVANMGQISFADSLQNFLALAQAGSPNGEVGTSSFTDQQQFVGDNGLVSVSFNTSFSLNSANGGAQQGSSPGSTLSVTA